MPGCKPGDRAVVIAAVNYTADHLGHVGAFVALGEFDLLSTLIMRELCWTISPALRCLCGEMHTNSYPDRCLQPIRGDEKPAETTETPKELQNA